MAVKKRFTSGQKNKILRDKKTKAGIKVKQPDVKRRTGNSLINEKEAANKLFNKLLLESSWVVNELCSKSIPAQL